MSTVSDDSVKTTQSVGNKLIHLGKTLLRADWFSAVAALIALFVIVGSVHPAFISFMQINNVLQQSVYVALMACGIAFLMTQGEIDLSVGGNYVLSMITAAMLMTIGVNPWIAALVALVLATAIGAVNAMIVELVGIPSLIATLAMGWVLRGLASALSEGKQVIGLPIDNSFFTVLGGGALFGIPVSVLIVIFTVIILTIVLRRTPFGFRVREIGSNIDAAQFAGIPINKTKTTAFLLTGLLAGVAGVLGLAFFTSGDPTSGGGYDLFAVAGAVIGGNPLTGGTATIFGAAVGAILLNTVSIALVYFSIPAVWSQFATGAVIIIAVSLDGILRIRRNRKNK
jgi:ribose/xylose/arabinose/galactoside ABC-type transport system permease subunit